MAVIGSIRPPPFVLWTVLLTLAEDVTASANATLNVTSNATTGIATDSASCQVGDNVTAIWGGDGKMYPAVIHSFGDDGTLTVDWADGDATFRTMAADKVQRNGFVCEPQIKKSKRNMAMVALALCCLIVGIGLCSLGVWLADGRLKQTRGSKVAPADPVDPATKLQCCDDEAVSPDSDAAKVPPLNSQESQPSQAHEGVADPPAPQAAVCPLETASAEAGSPDVVAAPPEDTSLNTEHIEEPPPAACQPSADTKTEPTEEASPPEASTVPAPASSSMQEARAPDEAATAPLAKAESPPTVFATPPQMTEADHKALSEWNDGIKEEPLSDDDNDSVAAKSEESV